MASDRDHPGLVLIDKGPDIRAEQYENAWHCDTTWRECPQMGGVLRCTEASDVGGDMLWADMTHAYVRLPEHVKAQIATLRARHSIEAVIGCSTRMCVPVRSRAGLERDACARRGPFRQSDPLNAPRAPVL